MTSEEVYKPTTRSKHCPDLCSLLCGNRCDRDDYESAAWPRFDLVCACGNCSAFLHLFVGDLDAAVRLILLKIIKNVDQAHLARSKASLKGMERSLIIRDPSARPFGNNSRPTGACKPATNLRTSTVCQAGSTDPEFRGDPDSKAKKRICQPRLL